MRPGLFALTRRAHDLGLGTSLVTNGLLIPRNEEHFASGEFDSIQVSLESNKPDVNDAIRGNGVFDSLVARTFPLLRKHRVPFSIAMTPTGMNMDDTEALAELACEVGAAALTIRRFLPMGAAEGLDIKPDAAADNWYKDYLYLIRDLRRRYQGRLEVRSGDPFFSALPEEASGLLDKKILGGCTAGIASCAISIDGTIKACTRLDVPFGNVLTEPLIDVWNSHPNLQRLRNRNCLKGDCGVCAKRWLCGGCRGSAFLYRNDMFASDILCPGLS